MFTSSRSWKKHTKWITTIFSRTNVYSIFILLSDLPQRCFSTNPVPKTSKRWQRIQQSELGNADINWSAVGENSHFVNFTVIMLFSIFFLGSIFLTNLRRGHSSVNGWSSSHRSPWIVRMGPGFQRSLSHLLILRNLLLSLEPWIMFSWDSFWAAKRWWWI